MNIQNQPTGPARSGAARSDEAGKAQDAGAPQQSAEGSNAPARPAEAPGDRVEISSAARAAQPGEDGGVDAALVERGREALAEGASLSEGRRAELKERAESGYYTQPEATSQIAERLAGELGGSSA